MLAVYLVMDLTAWYVVVPLCFASVLTGVISSPNTAWGLFRHYWVLLKIVVTIPSSLMLLVHLRPIGYLADIAAQTPASLADLRGLKAQLAIEAGAAVAVLLVVTALSVYKAERHDSIRVAQAARPTPGNAAGLVIRLTTRRRVFRFR